MLRYLSIATLLTTIACGNDGDALMQTTAPEPARPTVTYLALGDSYTIGEGVAAGQTFPFQLADSLRARGFDVRPPTVIARTGWRSDVLLGAIDETSTGPTPDLVTLLIGVNDQYQGRSAEEFRGNFRLVLDRAEALAVGGREDLIVVTIPDYSATPFASGRDTAAIRRALDGFDAVVVEEATARGLPVIDITPGSKAARQRPGVLLAADGLHPSGTQYAQWVSEMLPAVLAVVGE